MVEIFNCPNKACDCPELDTASPTIIADLQNLLQALINDYVCEIPETLDGACRLQDVISYLTDALCRIACVDKNISSKISALISQLTAYYVQEDFDTVLWVRLNVPENTPYDQQHITVVRPPSVSWAQLLDGECYIFLRDTNSGSRMVINNYFRPVTDGNAMNVRAMGSTCNVGTALTPNTMYVTKRISRVMTRTPNGTSGLMTLVNQSNTDNWYYTGIRFENGQSDGTIQPNIVIDRVYAVVHTHVRSWKVVEHTE